MEEQSGQPTHHELREALAELHEALSTNVQLDADLRTELEEVSEEITQALGRGLDASEPPEGEGTRLSDMAQRLALQLEVSHPTLTGVLNRVTHQLASLGI